MKLTDLSGKNICILGYGREGKAVFDAIERYAPNTHVTVADKNKDAFHDLVQRLENKTPFGFKRGFDMQCGEKTWLRALDKFDVIIKSPGIPPSELQKHSPAFASGLRPAGNSQFSILNSQLTNSSQILLDSIADRGAIVIGVTGSKGKSTTSSLIYSILKAAKKDVLLLGNIGEPAIAHLDEIKKDTHVVLEMSSYQLADLTVSPHIAVVTSFFPDHLDYHGSVDAYKEAKKHIARFQGEDDLLFFNASSPGAIDIAKEGNGRKIPFSPEDSPVTIEETQLLGDHNLSNITAACMVCAALGVDKKTALSAVKAFKGLPHRLQFLGEHHGIQWVDDAISTTPESTIAGLHALQGKVTTIILGGQDRGYMFDGLARELVSEHIAHAILFPGSGPRIREAIERTEDGRSIILHDAPDMDTAVRIARQVTKPGTICLLSTASPSYGMFKNFEEKGDKFAAEVTKN